jgi:hypothetical protein
MDLAAMTSEMWHTRQLAVAAGKRAAEMKRKAEAMETVAAGLRVAADKAAARVAMMLPPYPKRAKTELDAEPYRSNLDATSQATNERILSDIAATL